MSVEDTFGLIGRDVGNCHVESFVTEGGFGLVYKGHHRIYKTPCAVKVLKFPRGMEAARRATLVEKFFDEARMTRSLKHPAIVDVIDVGEFSDAAGQRTPWIAFEWVPGPTLKAHLATHRRRFSREEALDLLRPVIDALAVAHDHQVAHRDIKPANLMLMPTGAGALLRLLDFGIAKVMREDARPPGDTMTAGDRAFTPTYAAPEQIEGKTTGPWTDVHALGLILVELLAGEHPYGAQWMIRVIHPIRPTPQVFGIDAGPWQPVIERAIALDPKARFQHARELRKALEEGLGTKINPPPDPSPRTLPPPPPPPPPSWWPRVGMLLGASLVVAAAGYSVGRRLWPPRPTGWVRLPAPRAAWVLGRTDTTEGSRGFAPGTAVVFRGPEFELQEHEVTFEQYEAWAGARGVRVVLPRWVPAAADQRRLLPAVNVSWENAVAYCQSQGGDLPTELQWEYAARGEEHRPNPWRGLATGAEIHAYQGVEGRLAAVGASLADVTPQGVHDLGGNAQEWTGSRYRSDDGSEPAWTSGVRPVRGLPLREPPPRESVPAGLYRVAGCVTGGACNERDAVALESVGFRCARPARQ